MAGSNEAMIAIAYASRAASDRRNNRRKTIEVREFHLCLAQRFSRRISGWSRSCEERT
jgi:hypothetical protein